MNSKRNSSSRPLRLRLGPTLLKLLAALALALIVPARAETQPAAIPFSDIGARATANYQGDALGVTATADGARLRCGFQKLAGRATPEGLWLESTKPGGGQLRLVAVAVGRGGSRAPQCALTEAASSVRSGISIVTVPQGDQAPLGAPWTHGAASFFDLPLLRELETTFSEVPFYSHAAPDGATACLRQGAQTLARTGKVSGEDKLVRFIRPGLTEEYSVSVDGVRQDFVIAAPPAGAGELRVELALRGARAEEAAGGAKLRLEGSGRALAYSRLRVGDATGRELTARLEVLSASRLAVTVADANATYPVRIDPTFSDADWVSLAGLLGANGNVNAIVVDGSGNVYVGGFFTLIGTVLANNIAKWDGAAWSALGGGIGPVGATSPSVIALAVSGTNLYAGGGFTTAGGVPAKNIAKWDGNAWSALGSGISGGSNPYVNALAMIGTNLYAGGWFTTAGGVPANYIAKWDGSAWSALGSGMGGVSEPRVLSLGVSGTNLYAGGWFTTAGGVTAPYIAKWDGNAWSYLSVVGYVKGLAVSGTNLYAGGMFTNYSGLAQVVKWNGHAWSYLGSGMGPYYRYGGPIPNPYINALAISGTDLYAVGNFTEADGAPANYIAKWNGSAWSPLGSGMNGEVYALTADGAGHLFVGGDFSLAGTKVSCCIAQANLGSVPTVLNSPQTQTAEAGATVHLSVDAAGDPPPAYQWYLNCTNLLSCTSCDLVLTNILFSQSGTYTVVVTNAYGAVTSAPVMVKVIPAVERRPAVGVQLMGEAGSSLNVDYANALGPAPFWTPLGSLSLTSTSGDYLDLTMPLPPQRFYRAWQTGTPSVIPSLSMLGIAPAITLTGDIGHSVRLDYINQFGPIDAWVTLATVPLTNTSQLYFDVSAPGQPQRLYRIVPVP